MPPPSPGTGAVPPPDPSGIDSVYVLESDGPPPDDTVVTIKSGQARTILLRRGAPDNSLFGTVSFPDSSLVATSGDSAQVTLRTRPGRYGLDVETDGRLVRPARLEFSYAVHFVVPAGARERFGNELGFERALFIGRQQDRRVVFLPTARPGSDLTAAAITAPGRYLVGAPRY